MSHPARARGLRLIAVLALTGFACNGAIPGLESLDGLLAGAGAGSDSQVVAGLREALSVGTRNAVAQTSRPGGYLDDPALRIKLPGALDDLARGLRAVGYGPQVDELYVAMNRAAERSAAEAGDVFLTGIRQMSISDAMGILDGGDTAATEFFERTTRDTLFQRFEPIVTEKLGQVGAAQQYDSLVSRFDAIPFTDKPDLDLDHYVTNKALDGLFETLGAEESKIRRDPAARVTPLLKEVFGP